VGSYWWGMSNPRQDRPFRKVKPMTDEERLESMKRELAWRETAYGPNHWMVEMQRKMVLELMEKLQPSKGEASREEADRLIDQLWPES